MSKMREAFEDWNNRFTEPYQGAEKEAAWEGYQAAIAAVKENGAHAVLQGGSNPRFLDCIHRGVALPADQFLWPEEARLPSLTLVPLYRLPEDLL